MLVGGDRNFQATGQHGCQPLGELPSLRCNTNSRLDERGRTCGPNFRMSST